MSQSKAKAGESTGRFAYDGLEPVFHEKARLGIMTSLVSQPRGVVFSDLKEMCHLTDGNLSRHLQVLNEAGLVEIWKGFQKNRPQTLYRITDQGRGRFFEYINVLETVVNDAMTAAREPSPSAPSKRNLTDGWSPLELAARGRDGTLIPWKFALYRQVLVKSKHHDIEYEPMLCYWDRAREGVAMRVIRADVLGMCFGVRDALALIDKIDSPRAVTIHGQLVHNEIVQTRLESRGFAIEDERRRARSMPATPSVLITAHGISDKERNRLEGGGKRLIDTTCPLVTRVHQAAKALERDGYHVLLIGRRGHVEVEGITEDLDHCDVIESVDEVTAYPWARLGIVCQTTATDRHVASIRAAISAQNPDALIKFIDTVCLPTKEHQRALERLLERVDAVVVVGGRHSNNTRELVARCRESGKPAIHVQSAAELEPAWFRDFATVGLSAGTSTLAETIDQVHRALVWIGTGARVGEVQ